MIAARLHGVADLRLHTEDDPGPPPAGHSLVAVTAVGLCGSDLHWFTDGGIGDAVLADPVVPGHEMAGRALTGPHAGRRVAIDPAVPCGHCEQCLRGDQNLCPTVAFAGHGKIDGGLRERMVWPDHLLFPLPDSVSDHGGAVLEPLGVALHALDLGHLRLDDDVLVAGAGPIGLLLVQLAQRNGARRVFVTEPLAHRRAAAERYGAVVLDAGPGSGAAVHDATGGRGVDVVYEIAGTDAAIATAVEAARPGARVVLGGIPSDDRSSFVASGARRKGLTFSMVRRMNEVYPRAIRLAASGAVDLDGLVSSAFPLTEAAAAFAHASARAGLKTVVDVG